MPNYLFCCNEEWNLLTSQRCGKKAVDEQAASEMAPYLLVFFLIVTCVLVNLAGPRKTMGPRNYERDAEDAYKAAFQTVSAETVKRRKLVNLLLVIALLLDVLILVWIVRFG